MLTAGATGKRKEQEMNKAVIIISKILEVGHWVGCGFFTTFIIAIAVGREELIYKLSDMNSHTTNVEFNGLSFEAQNGTFTVSTLILFSVAGLVVCALTALMFRNLYLAFKTAEGRTKYSTGKTPFQPAVVKMIKRMGTICILIPIAELILDIISNVTMGDVLEMSVSMTGIFIGIVVLALSRFFAYGVELQNDVEGLV